MAKISSLITLILWVTVSTTAQSTTVSALVKSENSYHTRAHDWQKQEWQLDVELNTSFGAGDLTVIARALLDIEDRLNTPKHPDTYANMQSLRYSDEHFIAEMREFYYSF